MSRMRFCVMDVGQGSGNFVQYFNQDDPNAIAVNAGLIDVGSEGWSDEAGKPSARLIAQELKKMDPRWATLDQVMLSHSDSDHHNLIEILLDAFNKPVDGNPPVLQVNCTWYGGEYDLYQKRDERNVLRRLSDYRPAGWMTWDVRKKFEASWSSFDEPDPNKWAPVATIGGIELWVITANTTSAVVTSGTKRQKMDLKDKADGYSINTKSLVVAAKLGGTSVIATGDATGLTLAHCVNVLARPGVKAKLGTVFMITVPHHGSDTTTYSLNGGKSARGRRMAEAVVEELIGALKPQTVSASAGRRSNFRHPSINVISDFSAELLDDPKYIDPALPGTDQHFYTAYFEVDDELDWIPLIQPKKPPKNQGTKRKKPGGGGVPTTWPNSDGWKVARTPKNVFTTDYFWTHVNKLVPIAFPWEAKETKAVTYAPDPPSAVSWAFDVLDTGKTTVVAAFRRDGLHPARLAHVEALLGGPLPDDEFIWVPSAQLPAMVAPLPSDQSSDDAPPPQDAVPSTAPYPVPPGLGTARQLP